jgi:hypothetical protein
MPLVGEGTSVSLSPTEPELNALGAAFPLAHAVFRYIWISVAWSADYPGALRPMCSP